MTGPTFRSGPLSLSPGVSHLQYLLTVFNGRLFNYQDVGCHESEFLCTSSDSPLLAKNCHATSLEKSVPRDSNQTLANWHHLPVQDTGQVSVPTPSGSRCFLYQPWFKICKAKGLETYSSWNWGQLLDTMLIKTKTFKLGSEASLVIL